MRLNGFNSMLPEFDEVLAFIEFLLAQSALVYLSSCHFFAN